MCRIPFSKMFFPSVNASVFLVLHIIFQVVLSHQSAKDTCGEIYSLSNFSGEKFYLLDGEQSLNIAGRRGSEQCIRTGSMKVETGCRMKTCDEINLGGNCQILEQGVYTQSNLSFLTGNTIFSASCACGQECKCSDVFMKKSSCAHAYMKGGCKTCNALYTELVESESHVSYEFVGKVKALRLRQGCTLTLYSEQDFEGDEQTISNEINEDYAGIFKSYECECDDDDDEHVHNVFPTNSNNPPFINIPNTKVDLIKQLANYSEHLGLLASLKSLRNRRSPNNAYILAMGTVGSEKQETINLLFDNPNIFKTGESSTTTMGIKEVRIPVPVVELGIANSELRIIDTPEFSFSTRSLARSEDARVMATLDNFLATHEELSNRLPNFVLIFNNFNGSNTNEDSPFVKLLQGLHSFRDKITDEFYSNIIFIFPNICSEVTEIQLNPHLQIAQFKQAIENNTLFPHPKIITVAENNGKVHNLGMVSGYFKLPNGEYYPKNLFDKMELITENNDDILGQAVLRSAFRNPYDFNITSRKFKLVSRKSSKVKFYRGLLSSAIINANFSVGNTSTNLVDKGLVAGHSYNIFNDAQLPVSPFELADLHVSDLRFMIPTALTLHVVQQTVNNFFVFDNHVNYVKHRLHDLGLGGYIADNKFKGNIKPGHNVESISILNDSCSLSATKEFRLFQLVLNDDPQLTNEFISRVKSLPIFLEENHSSVENWRAFLNEYGTHIVDSIYGGGSIEVQLEVNTTCEFRAVEAFFEIIKILEEIENESRDLTRYLFHKEIGISLKLEGGISQYHTIDCSILNIEEIIKKVTDWKKSLRFSPVILPTQARLVPISEVMEKLGQSYVQQLEKTVSFLYGVPISVKRDSLKVISRNSIPFLTKMTGLLADYMQKPSAFTGYTATFGLRMPKYIKGLNVGFSYNLLNDALIPATPFRTDILRDSSIGYTLPTFQNCKKLSKPEVKNFKSYSQTISEYIRERLNYLEFEGKENSTQYKFNLRLKEGFNLKPNKNDNIASLTAVQEIRTLKCVLDKNQVVPNADILKAINYIDIFNPSSRESLIMWKSFFNEFGTHIVTLSYAGGSIHGSVEHVRQNTTEIFYSESNIDAVLSDILKFTNLSDSGFSYSFSGGNLNSQMYSLSDAEINFTLNEWKASLDSEFVRLNYELRLEPISNFIKDIDAEKGEWVQKALELLLQGELKYKRSNGTGSIPVRITTISTTRSRVELDCQLNNWRRRFERIIEIHEEQKRKANVGNLQKTN